MKYLVKLISVLLCCIMAFSFCACNFAEGGNSVGEMPPGQEQTQGNGEIGNNSGDGPNDKAESFVSTISYDYKDYIGDLETFVYGLLITKLEYLYYVFPASVQLSSGYCVYGLAYTDYTECYTNEDESTAYFMSGFLPFLGELEIPQDDFDSGLFLCNLDYEDEETKFVWRYKSDAFLEHCVVYGSYLQYGVSGDGQITYNAQPFSREVCDTSLGSLYSYDDSRYLYDVDFGNYVPINGVSIVETFDYEEFEKEVNAFIEEQNENWMTYDVQTVAHNSQEAVKAYLLSLQEETFFGYPVEQLVQATEDLDPMQCFRITPDGLTVVDIEEIPPEEPSALCKWLVGGACAIITAVSMVFTCVAPMFPPPLPHVISTLSGAATGAAIDVFMQVIIENKTLADVQWSKVGIAAVSGAVSGLLNPYFASLSGVKGFFIDSAFDGIVGGAEQAVLALIDGAKGEEVLARFGSGFILGAGISAGFKVIGKTLSVIGTSVAAKAKAVANKLSPKLTKTMAKFTDSIKGIGNAIGEKFKSLTKKVDDSLFRIRYGIKKSTYNEIIENAAKYGDTFTAPPELVGKAFKALKKDGLHDASGNLIKKSDLERLCLDSNIKNGDQIGYYVVKNNGINEKVYIYKRNGLPNVECDIKYGKVFPKKGITSDRMENFREATKLYREKWFSGEVEIPSDIKKALQEEYPGVDIKQILDKKNIGDDEFANTLIPLVQNSKYVFHEGVDNSVSLIPRALHDKVRGYEGVGHMGGKALMDYLQQKFGIRNFAELVDAATNGQK